ncbi:MAG TPA: response regulator transcription factor [Stellaceae bacterium]|nr:response regulator transcription factor [Stellaceae bacterium]
MRILIVDDHPICRAGLQRLLAGDGENEVREAASGREALVLFREFRPELVLLDLNLPGIGGLEVIARLKAEDAAARILVLSMHDDLIYVTRALQAGAAGYLSKSAPPDEVLEAIGRVAAGQSYIESAIAQELALMSVHERSHALEGLSRRDLEILRLLGGGASLPDIAEAIGVSYKTVANNCSQLKTKLGVGRTADLIRLSIMHGLVETAAANPGG